VFATDFTSVQRVGAFGIPFINYITAPNRYTLGWKSEFSVALMYGDRDYHDYFYRVDARYARDNRPPYRARAGYSGIQLNWILNRQIGSVLLIPFFRYDYLRHAVFEDSPLVITRHYFVFGLGSFYIF
jgi:MipA family protein